MENLQGSPELTGASPRVVFWFKIYTGVMAGIYALLLLGSPVLIWVARNKMTGDDRVGMAIQGVVLLAISTPLTIAFLLPFFLQRKPWVWTYNLVLICIGLTSCCFMPATIPLLIHWIKPETKTWFNRT